jgi:hypothetical protein
VRSGRFGVDATWLEGAMTQNLSVPMSAESRFERVRRSLLTGERAHYEIAAGRLDQRLFNVTLLLASGYGDQDRSDLRMGYARTFEQILD